jgi:hypothetical protein
VKKQKQGTKAPVNVCIPHLATKTPFTSKLNHAKAGRIEPPISAWTKKKRNTKGTSHIHFEGLYEPSSSLLLQRLLS